MGNCFIGVISRKYLYLKLLENAKRTVIYLKYSGTWFLTIKLSEIARFLIGSVVLQ